MHETADEDTPLSTSQTPARTKPLKPTPAMNTLWSIVRQDNILPTRKNCDSRLMCFPCHEKQLANVNKESSKYSADTQVCWLTGCPTKPEKRAQEWTTTRTLSFLVDIFWGIGWRYPLNPPVLASIFTDHRFVNGWDTSSCPNPVFSTVRCWEFYYARSRCWCSRLLMGKRVQDLPGSVKVLKRPWRFWRS